MSDKWPRLWPDHEHPQAGDGTLDCRRCPRCLLEAGWAEGYRAAREQVDRGVRPLGGYSPWNEGYKHALCDAMKALDEGRAPAPLLTANVLADTYHPGWQGGALRPGPEVSG